METFITFLFEFGRTLGVGASTFAITFFIMALQDGVMDETEKRFLRAVYTVLRIAMTLIAISLAWQLFTHAGTDFVTYLMEWILIIIITLNGTLMTAKIMPMRVGPSIAGGSWYSLFFVSALPVVSLPVPVIVLGYLVIIGIFYAILGKAKVHE